MSADVRLENVWIKFGSFVAAREVDLTIADGEFFSFLGPSGCGKTTILRAVSGFLKPSEGKILIGGQDMSGFGPNRRPTALIFQNLALFPLMSVWENITFALEVRGVKVAARRKKAEELLDLIALSGQGDKMVGELSGGQRQRVAIARALAAEPKVLLLDEPLSALDLKLRQHMRTELRAIQRRVGITFIYITHDQGEALTMSDHVAVMREGVIEQVADGTTIYDSPGSSFVASFVGENNLFRGRVVGINDGMAEVETNVGKLVARIPENTSAALSVGDSAHVFQRPESLRFAKGDEQVNRIKANIVNEEFEGNFWQVYLDVAGSSKPIRMSMVNDGKSSERRRGDTVEVCCNPALSVALADGPLAAE